MNKIYFTVIILSILLLFRLLFAYQQRHTYHAAEKVTIDTLLLSDIDRYNNRPSMTLVLPGSFPPQRVTVFLNAGTMVHFGQAIHIVGKISSKLLGANNTMLSIYFPHVSVVPSWSDSLLQGLYTVRKNIIEGYQSTLSDIDSSLLLGIVFGIKENVPKTFSQQLQATGVTHVIAASGMNVTIVAGFLMTCLGKFFRRQWAIGISILFLVLYAIFAGLQPSILRATIMGICAFSGQLLGRQYKSWYMLFVTGFCMLMLNPQLLYDIGFQLSFLSTLGIIVIQPLLQKQDFRLRS